MKNNQTDLDKKAIEWLERFSESIESDIDIIEAMPIEEVREKLRESGIDIERFHRKIDEIFNKYGHKIDNIGDNIIAWISPLWKPVWAGEPITAMDITEQKHEFASDFGEIHLVCQWKQRYGDDPAFIQLTWKADLLNPMNIWSRFINPETNERIADIFLGSYMAGERIIAENELGFNPSTDGWALSIVLADIQ